MAPYEKVIYPLNKSTLLITTPWQDEKLHHIHIINSGESKYVLVLKSTLNIKSTFIRPIIYSSTKFMKKLNVKYNHN